MTETNEQHIISDILNRNGLRLLWDAFDNLELLRASLIIQYLKNNNVSYSTHAIHRESLDYFESKLTDKIIQILTEEQTNDHFVSLTIEALSSSYSNRLLEYLKSQLATDLINGSVKIINLYNNINRQSRTCESINLLLFVETESNFCEYPQLQNIKIQANQSVNKAELKKDIKCFTSNFFTVNIDKLPAIDPEILKGLELEDELLNNILIKFKESKLKGNSEKIRSHLSDLFDKLMKSIQSTIRSNSVSVFDDSLKEKFKFVFETLENSHVPSEEIELIFISFDQIISNKSNIIFTIHRNELSAVNSRRETPIPSKLYLASKTLAYNVDKLSNSNLAVELLLKYIEQIKNKFYETWLNDIKITFNQLKEKNNEIFALIWLSESFLSLQISNDHMPHILTSLNIESIKSKYFAQAALLTGLFEPERILTPKLQDLNLSEPSREILPHFISL
jgi:hypothetical protein